MDALSCLAASCFTFSKRFFSISASSFRFLSAAGVVSPCLHVSAKFEVVTSGATLIQSDDNAF